MNLDMNLNYKSLAFSFFKVLAIMSIVFYVRNLKISEKYKILIMVLPTLIVLSYNNINNHIKYKNGNKPIYVRKNDEESDKYIPDELFIENYRNQLDDIFIVSNNVQIHEVESPFLIDKGYFDISNPNNFINLNDLNLGSNYTIELWLRLKYVSNDNILVFLNNNKVLLRVHYDNNFIYINDKTKIPMKYRNNWFQLVIMRGKYDTLGSDRGLYYINGIFNGYIENLPSLSKATNVFLFKNSGNYLEYNKNYNDLSNCSIVRMYSRSLSLDEIQNNYLKESSYYDLDSDNSIEKDKSNRMSVSDNTLIFYMDPRIKQELTDEKPIIIKTMDEENKKLNWIESAEKIQLDKKQNNTKKNKEKNKQSNFNETKTSKPVF